MVGCRGGSWHVEGCWGIPLLEQVDWFLGLLVSVCCLFRVWFLGVWFLGLLVSKCLGLLVSKIQ